MELKQIEYLLEVAKQGSLSKAAKALYISQPNLSCSLKGIEEELNICIFNRTSHGVIPTEQGRELIDSLSVIYCQLEMLLSKYKETPEEQTDLNLYHNELIFLPDGFFKFKEEYHLRELTCDIKSDSLLNVLEALAVSAVPAMGIVALPKLDAAGLKQVFLAKGIRMEEIFQTHGYLIVGRKHPFFERSSVSMEDVLKCQIATYSMSPYMQTSKFLGFFDAQNVHSFNSKAAIINLVAESTMCGLGSAFLEDPFYTGSSAIRYIPINDQRGDILFGTVRNEKVVLNETYGLYVDYLKQCFYKTYTY